MMFLMRGYDGVMPIHQKIWTLNLLLGSLFVLLISIKKPAAVFNSVQETKNIVLLQNSIWKEIDTKLSVVANNIVTRIQNVDCYAVFWDGFVVHDRLFHIIFLILPLSVEVLARWKKMTA